MNTAIGQCERCQSPLERGDLRCAICGAVVPADKVEREQLAIEVMRCDDCGAVTEYDVEFQAPHCAFCDATMHLERIEDPVEQTELTLPFKVTAEEASQTVRRWLGSLGWFRPGDLKAKAKLEGVRPLLWVGWCFDAEALVSWTADSNAGSRRSSWAPHAGQVQLQFDDVVVSASRGLSQAEVSFVARTYDLSSASDEIEAPAGVMREKFDVQRSAARELVANAVREVAQQRVEQDYVPGSRTRKVRVEPLIRSLVTRRYSFPAWVMAYRYDGKVYRAIVSGQDASAILGKAPYSVARILFAVLGSLALLLLILFTVL